MATTRLAIILNLPWDAIASHPAIIHITIISLELRLDGKIEVLIDENESR